MANTAAIAKKANTALVIDAVREAGELTIEEIASATRMSRPTVVSIVRSLQGDHVLKDAGRASSEVGRQPTLYAIDDTTHFAIGIDIDGPPARLVLADLAGKVRHSTEWRFGDDEDLESILATLVAKVEDALTACGLAAGQVLGIGLGLPASVDIDDNIAVNLSRLEALRGAPIAARLTAATGIAVEVRNDAHLIALAEGNEVAEDFLYIIFRTGVGMAIVIESDVFEGETGNAGFIGHTTIDPQGPLCQCGARGCLEAVVSKPAIAARYAKLSGQDATYEDVLARGATGEDEVAATVVLDAARWLGLAIGNLVKTLDIYTVVLGDLGCDRAHPFFAAIDDTVREITGTFLRRPPTLLVGRLSGTDFARGGATAVIDAFFATPRLRVRAGGDHGD